MAAMRMPREADRVIFSRARVEGSTNVTEAQSN